MARRGAALPLGAPGEAEDAADSSDADTAALVAVDALASSLPSSSSPAEPLDARAYWLLVLMGAGLLLPWNVVLNALPFFVNLYSASGGPGGSPAASYPFLVSSVYSFPAIPALFLMVFYGDRLALRTRILGTFAAQAAIMALTPVVAPWSSYAPLALMFVNGVCTGVLQSSLFGLCAPFPPIYAQGMLLGQGLAGALSSYAQIAVLAAAAAVPGGGSGSGSGSAAASSGAATAAYAYFSVAALVMVACCAAYLLFVRLPSTQRFLRGAPAVAGAEDAAAASIAASAASESGLELRRAGQRDGGEGLAPPEDGDGPKRPLLGATDAAAPQPSGVLVVLRGIWPQALALFLVFFMTFLVFPGLTIAIPFHGTSAALAAPGNWGIGLLAVFNTFDTVGRFLPGRVLCLSPGWLLPTSLLRFALVPLFVACVRGWAPPALFGADAFSVALVAVFAVGNGYTVSLLRGRSRARALLRTRACARTLSSHGEAPTPRPRNACRRARSSCWRRLSLRRATKSALASSSASF